MREDSNRALIRALGDHGCVGFELHQIEDLTVTEEEHDTGLHHILEDEVLIIVADFIDVAHD